MLRVDNAAAGYGAFQALFGVSLHVDKGESVAVIGPNGAGKTTLLRLISKLIEPRSGDVAFDGSSLARVPPHQVVERGIAHVPENRRLFPRLTTEENLRMGAFTSRAQFNQRLETVYGLFPRLKERERQVGGTLSGGEQQMLAIGRALMLSPKLLILDEATEGLAPLIREEIWSCLRRLKEYGHSILLIDKNLDELAPLAERSYIMEKGRIVWEGATQSLLGDEQLRLTYLGV